MEHFNKTITVELTFTVKIALKNADVGLKQANGDGLGTQTPAKAGQPRAPEQGSQGSLEPRAAWL